MYTYYVTFNMTSRSTVTGVKFQSNCDTVERFIEMFSPDMLVVCPCYGGPTVVNMRNVETMTVMKVGE